MGRPSKLLPHEWEAAIKRVDKGESIRAVAHELGVGEARLRERVSARKEETARAKALAKQQVTAEIAIQKLPFSAQITAQTEIADLRAISMHLASAAGYGAATAHRLQALAHGEVKKIDDADPLESMDALKGVGVLTKLANDSSSIALDLLAANKNAAAPTEDPFAAYSDKELLAIANGA